MLSKIVLKLIRHGKTDWNRFKRLQGHLDIPINEEGIKQAKAMAQLLDKQKIDHIYSSDLSRCRQTAAYLRLNHPEAVYHETEEFREGNAGILGGKAIGNFMKSEIQSLSSLKQFFTHYGETMEDVYGRVWKKLDQVVKSLHSAKENRPVTVAVVSHGGPIRMILAKLMGYYPNRLNEAASEIKVNNCSVTTIEIQNGIWELREYNFIDHLQDV